MKIVIILTLGILTLKAFALVGEFSRELPKPKASDDITPFEAHFQPGELWNKLAK